MSTIDGVSLFCASVVQIGPGAALPAPWWEVSYLHPWSTRITAPRRLGLLCNVNDRILKDIGLAPEETLHSKRTSSSGGEAHGVTR